MWPITWDLLWSRNKVYIWNVQIQTVVLSSSGSAAAPPSVRKYRKIYCKLLIVYFCILYPTITITDISPWQSSMSVIFTFLWTCLLVLTQLVNLWLRVSYVKHEARQRQQVNVRLTFKRVFRIVPLSVISLVLQRRSHADVPFQLVFGVFRFQSHLDRRRSRSVHNSHLPTGHASQPTKMYR